jgi:hypothetical protein
VSLFSFADENLEEVVQDPFPKVDWPKAMTRNINHQSRTKNREEKQRTSHIIWPNTGGQHIYGLVEVRAPSHHKRST